MLLERGRPLAQSAVQRLLSSFAVTCPHAGTQSPACAAGNDTMQARCYSADGASTSDSQPAPYSPPPGPTAPGRRTARSPDAWRARVSPDAGRYGVRLRQRDPQAFERMRLMLGFYDLPENARLRRPKRPKRVTISNLQALRFLPDVDPYYRLALLSYRTRGLNADIMARMGATQRFLDNLASDAGREFVPAISSTTAANSTSDASAMDSKQ